ncbi:transcription antitermination factor NusB [Thermosynechococcaceae cyanobacterium BACA0444]|uniref:Transcription antitermination protein NusB n=1 Tax=Pseudocalidococcus azoricus BACA0444 TaxID=2918990 RepID=A0AAE4FR27_9CYAN|nr:transcription antitermination factor NusB [Pseudocalidococcus azoricus]MDS3860719.1 transcription antitermination factor NusB [Pseudocalidococcus azoricus BACA0444]
MTSPRRIARELALLSVGQVLRQKQPPSNQDYKTLVLTGIRTLAGEAQEALEVAGSAVQESHATLLTGELQAATLSQAQATVQNAIGLTEKAINRLGIALELPEILYLAHQPEVQAQAVEILITLYKNHQEIDQRITAALVDWQLDRIAQLDRYILEIAVAEITYHNLPVQVAINEAVELSKRYSEEGGHRFINGVLRRVSDQLQAMSK